MPELEASKYIVFPACAGVIRCTGGKRLNFDSFPRMRGGDPVFHQVKSLIGKFSPHARG